MIGIPLYRTAFVSFKQFQNTSGYLCYIDNCEKDNVKIKYLYYRFNDIKIAAYNRYIEKNYDDIKKSYLREKTRREYEIYDEPLTVDILENYNISEKDICKLLEKQQNIEDYKVLYYTDYMYKGGDEALYMFECVLYCDEKSSIIHLVKLYPDK